MRHADGSLHLAAPWMWVGLSIAACLGSFVVAVPIAGQVARALSPVEGDPRWDLAVLLSVTSIASMGAVIGLARAIFGRWVEVGHRAAVLAVIGVVLAIGTELVLHEWAEARLGAYDMDNIGATALLSAMVTFTATAGFADHVSPPGAATATRAWLLFAGVLVFLIVVSNVPGLADGIDPGSWPAAALVGASGAYAVAMIALSVRRRRLT